MVVRAEPIRQPPETPTPQTAADAPTAPTRTDRDLAPPPPSHSPANAGAIGGSLNLTPTASLPPPVGQGPRPSAAAPRRALRARP